MDGHAGTGILELDSKPGGAEVFVDGKKKGTTPETEGQKLTMELAEGDHEWSCAVGIGGQENARDTPESKDGKPPGFPWGGGYPPPKNNVGNYRDSTVVNKGETESSELGSYDDRYLLTSQVMNYPANTLGIYDLGRNVWEWCQDLYKPSENRRVLRGGSWHTHDRYNVSSACRFGSTPVSRDYGDRGFR